MFDKNDFSGNEITIYLEEFSKGNKHAFNKLFPLVYNELRKNAHSIRFHFFDLQTMNTTAIVHETYLKLLQSGSKNFKNRSHFYYIASKAMRQILVNSSLKKRTMKRGGEEKIISMDVIQDHVYISDQTSEELLMLNEALQKLENENSRQAKIVECRFFGGMSIEETASVLDVSPATVKRSWNFARTWLYSELSYG